VSDSTRIARMSNYFEELLILVALRPVFYLLLATIMNCFLFLVAQTSKTD